MKRTAEMRMKRALVETSQTVHDSVLVCCIGREGYSKSSMVRLFVIANLSLLLLTCSKNFGYITST